ncbi:MAG: DUF2442 domain-containing protein [Defluviitaleaceae bacterium]|nr:DUF2442 domain-containing protein [Defluviitaleaceae bacterium]
MYIVNGIAHADGGAESIEVSAIKPLEDMMMLITFTSGEKRLFDGTKLLKYPAFKPLADENIFMAAKVEDGVITWCNGDIDVAPEAMYRDSYAY